MLCTILFCITTNNEKMGDQGELQVHLYCFSAQEEILTRHSQHVTWGGGRPVAHEGQT